MDPTQLSPGQQAPANPKQQVVERVRNAGNVLVTVSSNPTVDQLAACIGLTLMLNKLEKHATAVFSGQVPSTIEFLHPEETLEKDTNSLRDFIISLDKNKADKLRYKVEENVVRILSEADLNFSQGDFNVDVIIALGVSQREQLDQAIMAHGRILHDATVVTISAGPTVSDLGAINWQDPAASSLCEMLVSISEAFQGGLLDTQIATAFLTGIVAETHRFSNTKTSPKVMTMAAQLMAAGANQQLIATQLQQAFVGADGEVHDQNSANVPAADGSLAIHHQGEAGGQPGAPDGSIHIDEHGNFNPLDGKPADNADQSTSGANAAGSDNPAGDGDKGRKIIAPLGPPPPPKTELSKLLAQEPEFGGTLTANTDRPDEKPEPSTDPLTLPPVVEPNANTNSGDDKGKSGTDTLKHDEPVFDLKTLDGSDKPPTSGLAAMPPAQDVQPLPPLTPPPLPPAPTASVAAPPIDAPPLPPLPPAPAPPPLSSLPPIPSAPPVPPQPSDDSTLLDIEKSVNTRHEDVRLASQNAGPPLPPPDPSIFETDTPAPAMPSSGPTPPSSAPASTPAAAPLPPPIDPASIPLPSNEPAPRAIPPLDTASSGSVVSEGDGTVDAARNAVEEAIKSLPYDANRPQPVQSLGATPVDLPLPGVPMVPPGPGLEVSEPAEPSHSLLPITPPPVPQDDSNEFIDPFAAPPEHPDPTFGPPAAPPPVGQFNMPPAGVPPLPPASDPSATPGSPPPVPPPMMNFPIPPQDQK
jgi:hypothetical protein